MIQALDPDPESNFKLFGNSGFGSSIKQNHNTYRGVVISAPDLDPELDFLPLCDSRSGIGSGKTWNHNSSSWFMDLDRQSGANSILSSVNGLHSRCYFFWPK